MIQQMGFGTNDLELLSTLKKRKLIYYSHLLKTEGNTIEKDIIVEASPGERRKEDHGSIG